MKTISFLSIFCPIAAFCDIAPTDSIIVASYESNGLYNLVGLGTWNGQPVSPTNFPSDANRELEDTINLLVSPQTPDQLFVQIEDVTTTIGAFWSGTAFENVTQSGISIEFPTPLGSATLNSNYANVGESLANGLSGTEIDTPLSNTPGFNLAFSGSLYTVATISGAEYGFSSLTGIYGAQRIHGGGVFDLIFPSSINLFDINYEDVSVDSLYGSQGSNQSIPAELMTPEPSLFAVIMLILTLLVAFRVSV